MSKHSDRDIALFNLAKRGVSYEDAKLIRRYAASYNGIQEKWCSLEMDAVETTKTEMKEKALEARITRLLGEYGLGVQFSGDPRGATVRGQSTSDERGLEEWFIA